MKIKSYLIFGIFFLNAVSAFSESAHVPKPVAAKEVAAKSSSSSLKSKEPSKTIAGNSGDVAQMVIDGTPELLLSVQEKIALKNYLYKLGLDQYGTDQSVGMSNKGLNTYFSKMFGKGRQNLTPATKCFQQKAVSFYEEVNKKIKSDKMSRAKINSKLGDEFSKDLKPGWLWELALKHADGNEYAAMTLIGVCGHDDVAQSGIISTKEVTVSLADKNKSKMFALENEIYELKEQKKMKLAELQKLNPDSATYSVTFKQLSEDVTEIDSWISLIEKELDAVGKSKSSAEPISYVNTSYTPCPHRDSAFYYPEGLGAGVDISPELKSKISKAQYATAPSKHYHVYGSAFMACGLIANGFGENKSVIIQTQSAKAYRGIRMCNEIRKNYKDAEFYESLVSVPAQKNGQTEEKFVYEQFKKLNCDDFVYSASQKLDERTKWCTLKTALFFGSGDASLTEDFVKQKLAPYARKFDAYKLYQSWYLGSKEVLGKQLPCTDIKTDGPKDIYNISANDVKEYKPKHWSDERFQTATKSLASMMVDFEWTAAQHEAGAKFAADKCKNAKGGLNPFDKLCPAGQTLASPAATQTTKPAPAVTPAGTAN